MNLKRKLWLLLLSSSLTALILLIGLSALIGLLFSRGYTHQSLRELGEQWTQQVELLNPDPEQIQKSLADFQSEHPSLSLSWLTPNGDLLYSTDGRTDDYDRHTLLNRFLHAPDYLWEADQLVTLLFDWQWEGEQQFLMMSLSSNDMQGSQIFLYIRDNAQFIQLVLPVALFILTPYLYAMLFFLKLNRRLTRLNRAMKQFGEDSTTVAVTDDAQDEIGELTRSFSEMAARIRANVAQIQELDAKRKSLIADISHDLRTPLTMIIGYAESLYKQLTKNPDEQMKYTHNLLRRAKYMDALLQKLLEIAQLDTYKQHARFIRQDLGETIRLIAADYISVVEEKGIEIDIQIPEQPIYVAYDQSLLERAIRNLIENAIQYGGEGRYLGIAVEKEEDYVQVSITDHGPGITEEKHRLIFERFYRGAEGRGGEGLGLGLSIAQEVATIHSGYIQVKSSPHAGTAFTVVLPFHR